jgi:hypothetical protein
VKQVKKRRRGKSEPWLEPSQNISYKGELIPASTRKTAINMIRELKKRGVKHVLVGAFPVQFYGRERLSRDVDIVVSLDERGAENLFELLKSERYTVLYPLKHEQEIISPSDLMRVGLLKVKDAETLSLVDIILRSAEVGFKFNGEPEERARTVILDGEQVLIPSPEDYLIMKLKSRRPGTHDFEDIMSTLSTQFSHLDWAYLQRRAEEEKLTSLLNHYKEAVESKMKKAEKR